MEYVDGESLAHVLRRADGLTAERTLEIVAQTASALDAAHRIGLVHRDIKPGNLLVDENGVVRVTDFGIARSMDATPLTRTGTIVGTPQYISPEQAQGRPATPASDLYSLGVVAYACLAGRAPFADSGNEISTAMAHIQHPPPPLPPHVPRNVAGFVMALLAKDPEDRPQSAATVAQLANTLLHDPTRVGVILPAPSGSADARARREARPGRGMKPAMQAAGAATARAGTAAGEASPRRWTRRWSTVAAVAVITLLGLSTFFFGSAASESVRVPDLVGKQVAEARAQLDDLGLTVRVQSIDEPGAEADSVDAQDPLPSTEVDAGTEVILTVVSGQVMVPDGLTGKSFEAAARLLSDVGLEAVRVVQTTEGHPPDRVMAVAPTGRVPDGSQVVLTVAAEPVVVREEVIVPDEPDSPSSSEPTSPDESKGKSKGESKSKGKSNGNSSASEPEVLDLPELGSGSTS
jgi:serine/threonine-protein kinase